jgi:hypothetical protein
LAYLHRASLIDGLTFAWRQKVYPLGGGEWLFGGNSHFAVWLRRSLSGHGRTGSITVCLCGAKISIVFMGEVFYLSGIVIT